MRMAKKSFFRERSLAEIKKLDLQKVYRARGLVDRIEDLGAEQGIMIRTDIIPLRFTRNITRLEASRKCYKHGNYIKLSQPRMRTEALDCRETPLKIRARNFSELRNMREEENFFLGYYWYPVQGRDRRQRRVPFAWILEGARIFSYAENFTRGIEIKPYDDAKRVKGEGAEIVCSAPSREKRKSRYLIKLKHVPVEGVTEKRAVVWSLCTEYDSEAPKSRTYNIRYTWENDREGSDVFTFYPGDIAAYYAVINHYLPDNLTPLEMTPLALPSKQAADFYTKLGNNILIYDPTIKSRDRLRKLHVAEKSILIARQIGKHGNYDIMYADGARDGKLKDYNWQPPKSA